MTTPEDAWQDIKTRRAVNLAWLAEQLDPVLSRAAISKWTRVPAERVVEISRLTGIPRNQLRPDLYEDNEPWSAL